MKRIEKNSIKLIALLLFVLMLIFAGQVSGEEQGYDEDAYGPADPIVWTKPVKAVVFNHKIHTMINGLECDNCHDETFEMAAGTAEENDDFTMESLYKGKYCGTCHDGDTAFASNTRCTSCHIGVRGYKRLHKAAETASGESHH